MDTMESIEPRDGGGSGTDLVKNQTHIKFIFIVSIIIIILVIVIVIITVLSNKSKKSSEKTDSKDTDSKDKQTNLFIFFNYTWKF